MIRGGASRAILAAALACCLVAPPPAASASASDLGLGLGLGPSESARGPLAKFMPGGPSRWQGRSATYFVASRGLWGPVRLAAKAWNSSGVGFRFRAVSRGRARLVIRAGSAMSGHGRTSIVAGRRGTIAIRRGAFSARPGPAERNRLVRLVAHELGHVIGLAHETRRCATMQPFIGSRCPDPPPGRYYCRVLEPDDVRGAVRLRGGRVGQPERRFCG